METPQFHVELLEKIENAGAGFRVERARRLVGNQELGAVHHRHGDGDPLRLSHAQLARIAANEFDVGRAGPCAPAFRRWRRRASRQRLSEWARQTSRSCVSRRSAGLSADIGTLQNQPDLLAADLAQFALAARHQLAAVEADGAANHAAAQFEQPRDREGEGALAGPAGADEAGDLAARQREAATSSSTARRPG